MLILLNIGLLILYSDNALLTFCKGTIFAENHTFLALFYPFMTLELKNILIENQCFENYFCRKCKKNLSVLKNVVFLHSQLRKEVFQMLQTVR